MTMRTHPYTILVNLWRVFYLVVIPVVRGFLAALQGDMAEWIQGAWLDILIFLIMISLATLQWSLQNYCYDSKGIQIRNGLLIRRYTHISWERITCTSLSFPFFLKPLQVSVLRADVLGGSHKNADISLYLNSKQARAAMLAYIGQDEFSNNHNDIYPEYRPKPASILALGMLSSNSFAGILFLATFVSQSGKLLGNEFSDMLIDTFEQAARNVALGIPPAAAAIAYFLIAGWMIAFIRTLLKYIDFSVLRKGQLLSISTGRFTDSMHLIDCCDVNYIDIRQTMGTKLFKLYSLYICVVGFGHRKDDNSCVIPAEKQQTFDQYRNLFFPDFQTGKAVAKPHRHGFMRFLSDPLLFCSGIPVIMVLTNRLVPSWKDFTLFVGLMSLVPSFLFLAVRITDFLSSGIGIQNQYYTIRYSSGFQLHTVIVPKEKIVEVKLRQSLFQRFSQNCDLTFYTVSETTRGHLCRNIPLKKAEPLLRQFNNQGGNPS